MTNLSIGFLFVASSFAIALQTIPMASAQSTTSGTTTGFGLGSTGFGVSATGLNSATTQSPTMTFQLQNSIRNSTVNPGTLVQPITQPSPLVRNHTPAIQSTSLGMPTSVTELTRQSLTPNMLSTPNPVMPNQANRSIYTPTVRPAVPTYKKSQLLQQMQPQLFNSY